jgi:cell shape-determining protein MreC
MKKDFSKRIERLEAKTESLRIDSAERQAKLLRLKQLEKENKNSIEALFLRLELEYGRKFTLADIVKRAAQAG